MLGGLNRGSVGIHHRWLGYLTEVTLRMEDEAISLTLSLNDNLVIRCAEFVKCLLGIFVGIGEGGPRLSHGIRHFEVMQVLS